MEVEESEVERKKWTNEGFERVENEEINGLRKKEGEREITESEKEGER